MHKLRTPFVLALAALFAACGGDSGSNPEVTTVVVTPVDATMDFLGATLKLSAEVRDQDGNAMSGVNLLWTSSNATVATVDDTGLVTALAAGSAVIRASAGSVFGDANITVSPAPCAEDIALSPGESKVVPATCAISIPAGSAGAAVQVSGAPPVVLGRLGVIAMPSW